MHALALDGDRLVADLAHPLLTALVVSGLAALGAWHDGAVLANVVTLDLAVDATHHPMPTSSAPHIASSKFPRLRNLDLSRNSSSPRTRQLLPIFETSTIVSELHHVTTPPVLDSLDARAVQVMLDRMPRLRSLRVPAWYGTAPELLHPTAALEVSLVKPWMPRQDLDGATKLRIQRGTTTRLLDLVELCHVMEHRFTRLEEEIRAIWAEIWRDLRARDERTTISRRRWERALAPCAGDFCEEGWRRFVGEPGEDTDVVLAIVRG